MKRDLEQFYVDAAGWDQELYRSAVIQRNWAYILVGVCLVIALVAVAAVAMLTPLKTVEPLFITYNEATGLVRVHREVGGGTRLTEDEAVIKAVICQYTIARETWDQPDQKERAQLVALMSDRPVATEYAQEVSPYNKDGLAAQLGTTTKRRTEVVSIAFLRKDTATVRFTTFDSRVNAVDTEKPVARSWIGIVQFRFVKKPMSDQDLFRNPLAFQVAAYRRDQEILEAAK